MQLLRIMLKVDSSTGERPRIGSKACELGVRPRNLQKPKLRSDVAAANDDDLVFPHHEQGLSCSQRTADEVVAGFFRPLFADERVWEIEIARLPTGLVAVHRPLPNDPDHWQVEPDRTMTLREFQLLLATTQPHWKAIQLSQSVI
jgi:hypothetical protein